MWNCKFWNPTPDILSDHHQHVAELELLKRNKNELSTELFYSVYYDESISICYRTFKLLDQMLQFLRKIHSIFMKVLFFRSETGARYLCSTDRFCHKTGKRIFMSINTEMFLPIIIKSKITIGSYMSFTSDYCLWRLWKEPRNVSSLANSRDYVQVRNFRNFCKNFSI